MDSKNQKIRTVAIVGMAANVFLLTIKLIVGFISHSQAMIADGLNSAGDVFSSVMTFIGNKISSKPGDSDHPYGHGKAEYIFSMIISFSLIIVAYTIIRSAVHSIFVRESFLFSYWLVVVSIITIGLKLILFFYVNAIGHKYNSLLAIANAQDHRNDVFITSFTLLSAVTAYYNIYLLDSIVGTLIGLWIGYTGFTIFSSAYYVLMDTNIDKEVKNKYIEIIEALDGVDHVDSITGKHIGLDLLLIVKISVDGTMSVIDGHAICDQVQQALLAFENNSEVVVHLNATQIHPQKHYLK